MIAGKRLSRALIDSIPRSVTALALVVCLILPLAAVAEASPVVWADLSAELRVRPGGPELLPAGPSRIDVGADGRAVVSAPLDHCLLLLSGAEAPTLRRVPYAGTPVSVDARRDGTLLVLDGRRLGADLIRLSKDLKRPVSIEAVDLPRDAGRLTGLRFDPAGDLLAVTFGNLSRRLADLGVEPASIDRGLPLALSERQAFLQKTGPRAAELRVASWSARGAWDGAGERRALATGAPEGFERWALETEASLGAVHLVGEAADGSLWVVAEELTETRPLRVRRSAWRLVAGEAAERRIELPPPGSVPVAREWALLPDGTFLLLQVELDAVRVLAWRAATSPETGREPKAGVQP